MEAVTLVMATVLVIARPEVRRRGRLGSRRTQKCLKSASADGPPEHTFGTRDLNINLFDCVILLYIDAQLQCVVLGKLWGALVGLSVTTVSHDTKMSPFSTVYRATATMTVARSRWSRTAEGGNAAAARLESDRAALARARARSPGPTARRHVG